MDDLSKEFVISYFDRTLQMHGDRPEAVGYSEKGQLLRFKSLLDIAADISGQKVLDYGCGKGDFYQFLKMNNIPVSYTGFDINENLIHLANRKFPECRFQVFDIEKEALDEDFDYIFLCGVFNLRIEDLDETIRNVLKLLFARCRKALAFNALSAHDPVRDFALHYTDPDQLLEFAVRHLSPYVVLSQSNIPHDITLFVSRTAVH